jgi:CRISPR-associated protein Cas1
MYGVVHAVMVALGVSPGLGFVHTGHERSFVYDVADLHKAEITIPTAFDVVVAGSTDVAGDTRRAVRDKMYDGALLVRCVKDIRALLLPDDDEVAVADGWFEADVVRLWDDTGEDAASGVNYDWDAS